MIAAHLPAIQIVAPLLAAALCVLVPWKRVSWGIAMAGAVTAFAASVGLLSRVLGGEDIRYALGGWAAPWGIEYRVDAVNGLVLLIVAGIGVVVTLFALTSVEREVDERRIPLFYGAWMLCLCGLLGIAITGDAFNIFVFLEISSLGTYALIAMGSDRRALVSAFRYLIMGSIGASFIVIGIGLLYVETGTLNLADLAERLPALTGERTVLVAFAFLTVGTSLKLALFPLHVWLPDAYAFAPSAVTGLIAATSTKVAVYVLLRFFFTVFGVTYSFGELSLGMWLLPLALVAIFTMSLVAIFQRNIKRMLAYSSVAQIGYIILGISFASVTGLTAATLHLFNHALMKGALFLALGCVMYRVGSVHIDALRGLGRRMPWTMAAFTAGGLSLIGVPLTVGFVSKWYLVLGALEQGMWPVAALVLVTSTLAVVYIWRVVEAVYFGEPSARAGSVSEAPLRLLVPTWALIVANLYFGIDASLTTNVAGQAARALLGGAP
ncbi:MAG: monovalent cation/H+ antiporter subunit D family protein [Gammaproteobacteria bacterium]|nr:monovalent cation/H+ antiporter subunit D family protein [Gammaproteobacteria bacterium]MDE0651947.1 monovalent cation/H+ antiporter subunit D family protein [Gammaproteobacteria bacterium]